MKDARHLVDPILDARALRAMQHLGPVCAEWVVPREGIDHDVVIVGGGQNGVALAFALRLQGVHRVTVIDGAPKDRVGVWRAPARMNVLRTPKTLVGPELGVAELSFRHWYEARHGAQAYDDIGFIKRRDWADYIDWFREMVDVPIRYGTALTRVEAFGEHIRVHVRCNGEDRVETCRKLVLTSGVVGVGGPYIPPSLSDALPRALYTHTSEAFDYATLRGKTIAVLGSAASAFDAAATALEQGAAHVHLFSRRAAIANKAPARLRAYPGASQTFHLLPDDVRWRMNLIAKRSGTTPPREALLRLSEQINFNIHLNADWTDIHANHGIVMFRDQGHPFQVDHVIVGTGYRADFSMQPELCMIADEVANWGDRYPAPSDLADADLARSPYLGESFQLQEKRQGSAPYLNNIHLYSAAAAVSFGRPVGDIPCMGTCLPHLMRALIHDLYFEDAQIHSRRAEQAAPEEFDPDIYAHAVSTTPIKA